MQNLSQSLCYENCDATKFHFRFSLTRPRERSNRSF